MICRNCESKINSGTKCFQCGYDNAMPLSSDSEIPKKQKRGPLLIVIMSVFIFINIISIISRIGLIIGDMNLAGITILLPMLTGLSPSIFYVQVPFLPYELIIVVSFAVAIFDIFLCICIIRLKKWAFKIYIVLTIVLGILAAINNISVLFIYLWSFIGVIFPFILKGLLLYVIYKIDGKHFGGTAFNEPVSVIRARQRREKEEKENLNRKD